MAYNMTNLQNSTTIFKLFEYANNSTDGVLVGLFVAAIFFVLTMMLKGYEFEKTLLVSSWLTFVIAIILSFAGLLSLYFALVFLIIAALTAFYMVTVRRG